MLQPDLIAKEDRRLDGQAECPQAKVPTYQELLDAALDSTFPASDPIAATAATHPHEPRTSARDTRDWTLMPGACSPMGQPGWEDHDHAEPSKAILLEDLRFEAGDQEPSLIPAGPCSIEQTSEQAMVYWQEGTETHHISLPLEDYRCLLAQGTLQRQEPA